MVPTFAETIKSRSCAALDRLEFGSFQNCMFLSWPTALDVTSEAVIQAIAFVKFAESESTSRLHSSEKGYRFLARLSLSDFHRVYLDCFLLGGGRQ